ncbi:MAG: sugar phosphate isomerase/epimerase [Candidatus Solibacter usitatus]|nr:sugar phosphate isomerase/epimerase [Candidatus Solibacter usitatus]
MRFGVNFFIWTANVTEEQFPLFPRIKAAGFDGIELPLLDPENCPAAAIRRELEANQLGATSCVVIPHRTSLFDEDASVRATAKDHVRRAIAVSAEAGSHMIAGPLYSPVGWLPGRRRTRDEWSRAIESYQELGATLDEYKMEMAIEPLNRFETFFLNTAADGAALCAAVKHPRIGLLIDTFHCNIEEKDIAAAYRTAAPHLKHVHTCENDRGIPGSGHVEWAAVFAALREIGYNGYLTIESFGYNIEAIAAAAAIWRDLASSPDAIAFEGIKFLKQNVA